MQKTWYCQKSHLRYFWILPTIFLHTFHTFTVYAIHFVKPCWEFSMYTTVYRSIAKFWSCVGQQFSMICNWLSLELKWTKLVSSRKKDALWDRLTALLRIVNETIVILLLTVRPKFNLLSDMNGRSLSGLILLLFISGISTIRSMDFRHPDLTDCAWLIGMRIWE